MTTFNEDVYRIAEGADLPDEEPVRIAMRVASPPMFDAVSWILLGSILAVAVVCLWTGFSWGAALSAEGSEPDRASGHVARPAGAPGGEAAYAAREAK